MYLKSLTLQGFKSFANRVELAFLPGITAIVGPNGSGKSNIADAIRWVLGEQSIRTLRGMSMQDIIFSGSDLKRPLGMAEVSLSLDNSNHLLPIEFSEVTVTRRVFRSGDSEFYINRTRCRLRDIQSLFLDSGLGRDTVSLIGQGEVDAVLSASAQERRLFLEDAAGIARYRVRKEEALEKLAETAENLVRVNDIVAEVELRLGPLQRAAKQAQRYNELTGRQTYLEQALLNHEWMRLDKQRNLELQRLDAANSSVQAMNTLLQEIELAREEEEKALEDALACVEADRTTIQQIREVQQAAAHTKELGNQRLQQIVRDIERAQQQQNLFNQQRERLGEELLTNQTKFEQYQSTEIQYKQRIDEYAQQITVVDNAMQTSQKQCEELRSELLSAKTAVARWEGELHSSISISAEADNRRAKLMQEKENQLSRLAETKNEYDRLHEQLKQGQHELTTCQQAHKDGQLSVQQSVSQQQQLEAEIAKQSRLYHEVKSRYQMLTAMVDSYEGYYEGARTVLAARSHLGEGIIGSVGELIQVPAELETAIETALGSAVQNILTRTNNDAQRAVTYLKNTKGGRATFLPIDALRYQVFTDKQLSMLNQPDVIGVAATLVSCDAKIMPAVKYLLGRTVVTRHLQTALALAKNLNSYQRIVTLDGDVVTPGGAITGGSHIKNRNSGILSRGRQLTNMQTQMDELADEINRLETALTATTNQIKQEESALKQLVNDMHKLELHIATIQRDLAATELKQKELTSSNQRFKEEEDLLNSQNNAWTQRLETAKREISASKERQAAVEQQLREITEQTGDLRTQQNTQRDELAKLRITMVETTQAASAAQNEVNRTQKLLTECNKQLAQVIEQLAQSKLEHEQIITQINEAEATQAEHQHQLEKKQTDLANSRRIAEEYRQKLAANMEQIRQTHKDKEDAQEKLHRSQVSLERVAVAIGAVEERLTERGVQPTPSAQDFDAGAARREIAQLRQEISELGPVNHSALVEVEEVTARYNFLCTQRADLIAAKEGLEETIQEIDQTSTKRLCAIFDAVNKAFQDIFCELFGGGDADLSWTDADHPLESGIEINVQPPGKKRQPLMALSGGERALTAIAFLFGILVVRPGPFCVLDEIDAALDDQNVSRFASMLTRFAGKTQFIVITHRQQTMECADTLYGISMDRAAVSQLMSLRLTH